MLNAIRVLAELAIITCSLAMIVLCCTFIYQDLRRKP